MGGRMALVLVVAALTGVPAWAQTAPQEGAPPSAFKVGGAGGVTMGKPAGGQTMSIGSSQGAVQGTSSPQPGSSVIPSAKPRTARLTDKTQGNCDGLNRRRARFMHGCEE
ncbi:MAG: hypothetical protein HQL33_00090 [Alphaproteobacteria bacterium]|nr:hypothetical protein [Alphaproteobacteria bacterium]